MKNTELNQSTATPRVYHTLESFSTPLHGWEACTQFLSAIAHTGEIWIKASWDLRTPPPHNWPTKKDGSPVNHVYTGTVNETGFSLTLCEYAGRDEDSNSIWQPTGQHYSDGFAHCLELSHAGATIYFYPNQPQGGISNAHVAGTDLIFYEIDDLPLAQQQEALNRFCTLTGLEPAAVVFTGGKSLHVYFRLTENVSPSEWQKLNRKVTVIQNSDPAICNPARAMRVPGLVRRKVVDGKLTEPVQITLERFSDAAYTPADFEASLDSTGLFPHGLSDERWRQWQRAKRDGQDTSAILQKPESDLVPKWVPAVRTLINDGSAVPLEKLLSKDDQALYNNGAGEGNRDNAGYKFARNVFATYARALELGIRIIGDPLQYIKEYGSRCTPPLPERDIDRIYRSATRGNPSATLSDEILLACAAAYQHRQNTSILSRPPGEISRAEWESRYALQQAQTKLANFLNRVAKQSRQRLASSVGAKASGPTEEKQVSGGLVPYGVIVSDAGERTYRYEPGNLPTPERWLWLGKPRILRTQALTHEGAAEALAKGWRHIHDSSGTGAFKSYTWGKVSLGTFPTIDQVFYITGDAENPTTATVESNFERLTTRHDGQVYDYSHRTPSGRPHIRRAKAGESANIDANCPSASIFHGLQEKGTFMRGGKESPVCQACPRLAAGCEFIAKRAQQLQNEGFLRAHPDQMPEKFREGHRVLNIWDEPDQTFRVNKLIHWSWENLRLGLQRVATANLELCNHLTPIFAAWGHALMGQSGKINPCHELNFIKVCELLKFPRFIAGPSGVRDILEIAEAADKLLNPQIALSGNQTPTEKQAWIQENWHPRYFSLVFGALTGTDEHTSISIDHRWNFTVSRPDRHHRKVVAAAELDVYLDATQTIGDLALKLGVKKDEILPYEIIEAGTEKPNIPNLVVRPVTRIGKCGQNREAGSQFSQQERLDKFNAAHNAQILEADPSAIIATIDFKKYTVEGGYYWFLHSRGTNELKDADHLKLIGLPTPNLGAMAMEWQAMTGNAVAPYPLTGAYGAWVRRKICAEVVQAVGRVRAHLSPDKQKTVWLIGDGFDDAIIEAIQRAFPGCVVEEPIAAADICLEAAPKGEQRERAIVNAFFDAVKAGKKITTTQIAKNLGITQGRISQITASWGGFRRLKKLLVFLLEAIQGKLIISELDADALSIARQYLPALASQLEVGEPTDLIEELANVREAFGHRTYLGILAATPPATLGIFLKWALLHLPPTLLERIRPDDPIADPNPA